VRSLLAECAHDLGDVTCVVNNASLFEYDDAASFGTENLVRSMRSNVAAPVLLRRRRCMRLCRNTTVAW